MKQETRILLVDDEEDLVFYLLKRLTGMGFRVTGATSGQEALSAAEDAVFDVAVVDLRMPVMGGEEVARRLKIRQPLLQVVILTGHASIDSALECGSQGVFSYLSKPHDFKALTKVLREAHLAKRDEQRERFEEKLSRVLERQGTSPQVLLAEWRRLQEEFEQ